MDGCTVNVKQDVQVSQALEEACFKTVLYTSLTVRGQISIKCTSLDFEFN